MVANLIHSLDATSLALLSNNFNNVYYNTSPQFFAIHDCFGTTLDKVEILKTLLASVYVDIYSDDQYLVNFDSFVLDYIKTHIRDGDLDIENRTITIAEGVTNKVSKYSIHDIN